MVKGRYIKDDLKGIFQDELANILKTEKASSLHGGGGVPLLLRLLTNTELISLA